VIGLIAEPRHVIGRLVVKMSTIYGLILVGLSGHATGERDPGIGRIRMVPRCPLSCGACIELCQHGVF